MQMRSGIALLEEIALHRRGELYRQMLEADDEFHARHSRALRRFIVRWGRKPMRLWSRQWEYPYAAEKILEFSANRGNAPLKILDAGSGVTFFPYYICSQIEDAQFTCCDGNAAYGKVFERLQHDGASEAVKFAPAMLQDLPFESGGLDAICCISVLEHTGDYERILDEFRRVLKPGGLLVLTFDISLDGRDQIPRDEARSLLAAVSERFGNDGANLLAELDRLDDIQSVLTTDAIKRTEPELLPWQWPRLKSLYDFLHGRGFTGGFFSLACYCLHAYAPDDRPQQGNEANA